MKRYEITATINPKEYGAWCRAEEVKQLEMRYAELKSEYADLKARKENARLEEEYDAICEHVMDMYDVMRHITLLGFGLVCPDKIVRKAEKALRSFENDTRLNASVLIDETYGEIKS